MNVLTFDTEEQIGIAAGYYMCGQVLQKPNSVLGLATGSTPIKAYQQMIELYKKGAVDFSQVTSFNLDEYVHLDVKDKNSYHTFMHDNLFDYINIPEENINFLDGNASDLEQECKNYEKKIKACGGIDIQLLGIGRNGHIGFNEPSDHFTSGTYKVSLTPSTIEANRIYFDSEEEMPREAITMGVESILKAKTVILIATGKFKAEAVRDMVKGEVSPSCPASVLQKHPDAYMFVDEEAAALL